MKRNIITISQHYQEIKKVLFQTESEVLCVLGFNLAFPNPIPIFLHLVLYITGMWQKTIVLIQTRACLSALQQAHLECYLSKLCSTIITILRTTKYSHLSIAWSIWTSTVLLRFLTLLHKMSLNRNTDAIKIVTTETKKLFDEIDILFTQISPHKLYTLIAFAL